MRETHPGGGRSSVRPSAGRGDALAAIVMFCGAICGALSWTASEATAAQCQLMIASRPAGATVYVDDSERGKTPLVLSDLKVGSHVVKIVLDGHVTSTKRIRLRPGAKTHVVRLEANAAAKPEPRKKEPAPDPAPTDTGNAAATGRPDKAARAKPRKPASGTKDSRTAIARAIEWLVSVQEADGRWDGERRFAPGDSGKDTDPGVTGLALMALMGAGNSETRGAHSDAVRRGLKWLISKQAASGEIGGGYDVGRGYNHAIAGLALAEAACNSRSPEMSRALGKAVGFATKGLGYRGWRYRPGSPGDMSVTVWYVMLCRKAKGVGVRVDGLAFQSAIALTDKCTKPNGMVSYQPERAGTPTMTAAGLICLVNFFFKNTDERVKQAEKYIAGTPPDWEGAANFYYWHMASIALCRLGSESWGDWNQALHQALLPNQRTGDPELAGSWDPVGAWCGSGGRIYATAMATLCLEAPQRYPSYYR